jgi:TRAP-type transport system periplasmic protein
MVKVLARCAIFLFALLPLASEAEPITLKLSYYSSDRSATYLQLIKPFVDAVNGDGQGLLNIQVYFSGALGRLQAQQPQLVDDDAADIALIIIGQTPERFEDSAVIELPGLFRDAREATMLWRDTNISSSSQPSPPIPIAFTPASPLRHSPI